MTQEEFDEGATAQRALRESQGYEMFLEVPECWFEPRLFFGSVVQSGEHRPVTPKVAGSKPAGVAKK